SWPRDAASAAVSRRTLFFFTATAAPAIYSLSLHDALPIFGRRHELLALAGGGARLLPVEAGTRGCDDRHGNHGEHDDAVGHQQIFTAIMVRSSSHGPPPV